MNKRTYIYIVLLLISINFIFAQTENRGLTKVQISQIQNDSKDVVKN